MARVNERERIEILMMIGYGDRMRTQLEVSELFNNKYPNRAPISQSTISKIEKKYRDLGHVRDNYVKGRPTISEDVQLNVLLSVEENNHKVSRAIADENKISQGSVLNYLHKNKWHPYKVQLVHELNEDDPDRRMQFCEIMMERCIDDPQFSRRIVFSDEATFCLNGTVNRQNFRYWATENPHWIMECHTQYPQKVNVWAGIIGNRILGPFFFDGTLTGERYLEFLEFDLIPALAVVYPNPEDPDIPNDSLWYQQDGAPAHFTRPVREYLDSVFPGRWIGRRGPIEWPARSPDLTPLDYYLWGYLKSKVYINRPNNIDELKTRIRQEMRLIEPQIVHNVLQEFEDRLGYCQDVGGGQFQHLLN